MSVRNHRWSQLASSSLEAFICLEIDACELVDADAAWAAEKPTGVMHAPQTSVQRTSSVAKGNHLFCCMLATATEQSASAPQQRESKSQVRRTLHKMREIHE